MNHAEEGVDLNTEFRLLRKPGPDYSEGNNLFQRYVLPPVPIDKVSPDSIVVRNMYLSVDRTNYSWIVGERTGVDPVQVGDVMKSYGVGEVIYSNSTDVKIGDKVFGMLNWQKYSVVKVKEIKKIPQMGVYGIPGLTAWIGLHKSAQIKKGEVVLVTGASGAVGELAVQIARNHGCQLIAIVSGQQEIKYFKQLGIDQCINYRNQQVSSQLSRLSPQGIDVVFDVVGGQLLDSTLHHLKPKSRIVLCGTACQTSFKYKSADNLTNYMQLIMKRCKVIGFDHSSFHNDYPEAFRQLSAQVEDGKLIGRLKIYQGLDQAPTALKHLLKSQTRGKSIVQIQNTLSPKL